MEKKDYNCSLILPKIYLVFSVPIAVFYAIACVIDFEQIGLVMLLGTTPTAVVIGSLVSIHLINKYDIHIGQYFLYYIPAILIPVIAVIVFVIYVSTGLDDEFVNCLVIRMPIISLIAYFVLLHIKIKDFKERLVVILTSLLPYFVLLVICILSGFALGY